ncbi:MAG: adenylate/guanylate cyclase domain-containing protein [Campylobacterales bacterium]
MKRIGVLVVAYLAITLLISQFIIHPLHLLETLRLKSEDGLLIAREALGLAPRAPEEIVIVAIDDLSIHKIGRWPWDRRIMADLFDKLRPAKLVAVDIVFAEPQSPEADARLAEAIASHGRVIAGFFGRNDSNITLSADALDELAISEYRGYTATGESLGVASMRSLNVNVPPILSSPLASAPFNAEPDSDGLYRNYPIGYLYQGLFFLNLALQSWRYATGYEINMTITPEKIVEVSEGNRTFTPVNGRFLALNYYHPASIKTVSAVDILEGKNIDAIRNKVVFLGVTEIGIYDMRPTPINSVTPGVWLHYTAYGNMIEGSFLRHLPYATPLGSLLLGTLVLALFGRARFRERAAGYMALLLGWIGGAVWLFCSYATVLPLFYPLLTLILAVIANESVHLFFSEARIKELRKAFASYVSPEILDLITANPDTLKLGGEKKEITILFSDIRNFTTLSESMPPEQLLALLNDFLDPMTEEILKEHGMLDKYIGDAIMALYNVPLDQLDHAAAAARSALALMRVLHTQNEKLGTTLDIGVGIHTGEAVIGNVGSKTRFDYTAIGDAVNLASRLEGLTKSYHAHIIISDATARQLGDGFVLRPLDRVRVKGKNDAVVIHELLPDTPENRHLAKAFAQALEYYFAGKFQEALKAFEALEPDGPSSLFAERCRHLLAKPPAIWDGIWTMTTK